MTKVVKMVKYLGIVGRWSFPFLTSKGWSHIYYCCRGPALHLYSPHCRNSNPSASQLPFQVKNNSHSKRICNIFLKITFLPTQKKYCRRMDCFKLYLVSNYCIWFLEFFVLHCIEFPPSALLPQYLPATCYSRQDFINGNVGRHTFTRNYVWTHIIILNYNL